MGRSIRARPRSCTRRPIAGRRSQRAGARGPAARVRVARRSARRGAGTALVRAHSRQNGGRDAAVVRVAHQTGRLGGGRCPDGTPVVRGLHQGRSPVRGAHQTRGRGAAGRLSGRPRGPTGRLWCTPRTTGCTADRTGRRIRGHPTRARGSLWGPYGPQNPVPGSCRTGALRGDHGTCRSCVGRRVRSGSWLAVVPQHADRGLRRPMAIACRHEGSVSSEAAPVMAADPGGQTR